MTAKVEDFPILTPYMKFIVQYIFPGGELDHIGMTCGALERAGFEVHEVEALREHFGLTCQHWAKRLYARQDEGAALIGLPKTRLWLLYLSLCALSFQRGALNVFQVVASSRRVGASGVAFDRKADYGVDAPSNRPGSGQGGAGPRYRMPEPRTARGDVFPAMDPKEFDPKRRLRAKSRRRDGRLCARSVYRKWRGLNWPWRILSWVLDRALRDLAGAVRHQGPLPQASRRAHHDRHAGPRRDGGGASFNFYFKPIAIKFRADGMTIANPPGRTRNPSSRPAIAGDARRRRSR